MSAEPAPAPPRQPVPLPEDALSPVTEDYLKVVWSAQEWSDVPVTTKMLAARLGVAPSTVSETVRRLSGAGLLAHAPYGAVGLTETGRRHALAVVRRHRLIETFLVEVLGYGWDEVHDEAEVLEHAVSARFVDAVDAHLGHPRRDPHGDPVPAPDGTIHIPPAVPCWDAEPGGHQVARISDADPELLRWLEGVGLVLDTPVQVHAGTGVADVRRLEPAGLPAVDLGRAAAAAIWLTPAGSRGA